MFSTKLRPEEVESEYRQDALKRDTSQLTIAIYLALIPIAVFVLNDILTFSDNYLFTEIVIGRIIMTVWSLVVIFMLRQSRHFIIIDRIMLLWLIGVSLLTLMISYSRPDDYIAAIVLNILYVMAIYVMFPVPLYMHVIAGTLISLGECMMMFTVKNLQIIPGGLIMLLSGFILANLFGFIASYQRHRSHRRQFVLLNNEREIKAKLHYALSEVKTLRGIIPICSMCRKIRNDEGYYEVVEQYLKRHSDADFSHTLCPDCLSQQMDELAKHR